MVKSGKAVIDNIPEQFTLGKGHVKFFYIRLTFLFKRYVHIYEECMKRGFKVTDYSEAWLDIPEQYMNDWRPPEHEVTRVKNLLYERINNRLQGVK